jgi:hypothetical protein
MFKINKDYRHLTWEPANIDIVSPWLNFSTEKDSVLGKMRAQEKLKI